MVAFRNSHRNVRTPYVGMWSRSRASWICGPRLEPGTEGNGRPPIRQGAGLYCLRDSALVTGRLLCRLRRSPSDGYVAITLRVMSHAGSPRTPIRQLRSGPSGITKEPAQLYRRTSCCRCHRALGMSLRPVRRVRFRLFDSAQTRVQEQRQGAGQTDR